MSEIETHTHTETEKAVATLPRLAKQTRASIIWAAGSFFLCLKSDYKDKRVNNKPSAPVSIAFVLL